MRRLRSARDAAEALYEAKAGSSLQAVWEDWPIAWRIALEMVERYGARNVTATEALERLRRLRLADGALTYAWESGNAERHDPDGSADHLRGIALKPRTPGGRLHIGEVIMRNGIIIASDTDGVWDLDAGTLKLRPIPKRNGDVVAPPQALDFRQIAKAGMNHLEEVAAVVFPFGK